VNGGAVKQLVGGGTKLRPCTTDMMDGSVKAAMALYSELNAKSESWRKIYAD
jgi:TRAP-type mannitol/chloroaromatic compound transport system substrate-binding protein